MKKYQVISDFRHTITLHGKRLLVSPGDVIQSDVPLNYVFLSEVSEETPVTKTKTINTLQSQLKSIEQEKTEAVIHTTEEITSKIDGIETGVHEINEHVDNIEKELSQFKENEFSSFQKLVLKRLDILKDAIRTLEEVVYGDDEDPK